MKVSCQVISDLLPLSVEGLASPASAALIEEHLEECPDCQRLRAELEAPLPAPAEGAHLPLKRLRRALWRKKALAVLSSVFFTLALAVTAVGYLTAPEYLSIDEQGVTVERLGEDLLLLRFEPAVSGYEAELYPDMQGRGLVCSISAWNTPWGEEFGKKLPEEQLLASERGEITAVYYSAVDGSEDVLLYGRDQAPGGGVATLPRLFLTYYMQLALGAALVLALLLLLLKKSMRAKRLLSRLLMLPLAYLLSQIVLIGSHTAKASANRDFFAILLLALPLYALLLTALAWVERRKKPD